MSCASEDSSSSHSDSSRPSSPGIVPVLIGDEKENKDHQVSSLKKQIQTIERQVQKSLQESNVNPASRAKFVSICSKFERTSPTRSALADGSVLNRAKFFAESPEERARREKDLQERRNRFKVTKSSFELFEDCDGGDEDRNNEGSAVLQSIFHRKDSEKRLAKEMERLKIEEEAKLEQKKAFAEKVSMFGKVA